MKRRYFSVEFRRRQIVGLIRKRGPLTAKRVSRALKVDESYACRLMRRMAQQGIGLRRIEERSYRYALDRQLEVRT